LEVAEKFKTLPPSELQWVLAETKRTVANNRLLTQMALQHATTEEEMAAGNQRLQTLSILSELLEGIS
jgi:hypothetical protein